MAIYKLNALPGVWDIVLLVRYIFRQEGVAMENRRTLFSDRRKNKEILNVSSKGCKGAAITGNRRGISNRRLDVIDLIHLLEDDIDRIYFGDT